MSGIQVTISRDHVHSVTIQGGFTGTYINLDAISPAEAYELWQALNAKRDELRELAERYFDCRECGETHSKDVKGCPNIG